MSETALLAREMNDSGSTPHTYLAELRLELSAIQNGTLPSNPEHVQYLAGEVADLTALLAL